MTQAYTLICIINLMFLRARLKCMMNFCKRLLLLYTLSGIAVCWGAEFDTHIPMHDGGKSTYYVIGELEGLGDVELMVDTGSSYLAIDEEAIATLVESGAAFYSREIRGMLANGSEMVIPIYTVKSLNIGGECRLNNVEAAVFPGNTRLILGLSVLSKAAPFIFSIDPPQLILSHCGDTSSI